MCDFAVLPRRHHQQHADLRSALQAAQQQHGERAVRLLHLHFCCHTLVVISSSVRTFNLLIKQRGNNTVRGGGGCAVCSWM
jgi:hypothetical protein